jgi:hypothetical protein
MPRMAAVWVKYVILLPMIIVSQHVICIKKRNYVIFIWLECVIIFDQIRIIREIQNDD